MNIKRIILINVLLVIPLVVVIGWFVFQSLRGPDWRSALDAYLEYPGKQASILKSSQAEKSWAFGAELSQRTFGDSVYFMTSYGDQGTTEISAFRETDQPLVPLDSRNPLPYPPEEVWCIVLDGQAKLQADSKMGWRVVYAARHADMYNADWIIHESPWTYPSAEIFQIFEQLGCELP